MCKIPVLDEKDLNSLIEQALKGDGVLATPKEYSQMLIYMQGVSINSKPRKDGRFQGYLLSNEKKVYVYGKTKEEVAFKIKFYLQSGVPNRKKRKSATPLLSDWLDKWIDLYKKPNIKPKSLESILTALKPLKKAFKNKMIGDIKTDDLQIFLLTLTAERSRDICISVAKQSFEKAKKQGIIKDNPFDGVEIKKHKYKHKNALTLEEQNTLLREVRGKAIEPLFRLLLTTGIRIGEALALTAPDVDFKAKTININKNVVEIKGKRIIQDTPKTEAGARTIPVPENVLLLFKDCSGDLFDLSYNTVRLAFRRIKQKTNIAISAHILRHTYATRLEEAGLSPKVKQYLLGHSSIQMTQNIYTDVQKAYIDTLSSKITSAFDTEN